MQTRRPPSASALVISRKVRYSELPHGCSLTDAITQRLLEAFSDLSDMRITPSVIQDRASEAAEVLAAHIQSVYHGAKCTSTSLFEDDETDPCDKRLAHASVNTSAWPHSDAVEASELATRLITSRQAAVNDRNFAVHRSQKLLTELNDTRRRCSQLEAQLEAMKAQSQKTEFHSAEPSLIIWAPRLPIMASETCTRDVSCQAQLQPVIPKPLEETHLTCKIDAQQAVIASLENEVERLRRERDDAHSNHQSRFDQLVRDLEEAKESLEESTTDWDSKMKELNRLRTLMRFSQLKQDSDRLHQANKRIDELESSVRRYQMAAQRFDKDRSEYRRLRLLDAHCNALLERNGHLSEIPSHLLKSAPANAQDRNVPEAVDTRLASAKEVAPTVPESEVSFSTIAERMQQYLAKKKAAADSGIPEKKPRPSTASSQRTHVAGTLRPSSARTMQRQNGRREETPSKPQLEAPAKSYSFIGGKIVPFYRASKQR